MRKLFTLIIVFSLQQHSYCQKHTNFIEDSIIGRFMSWKISEDSLKYAKQGFLHFEFSQTLLEWNFNIPIDKGITNKVDESYIFNMKMEVLSDKDKEFIISQSHAYLTKQWQLQNNALKITDKKYGTYYSLPLFSNDKQFVILKEMYYCGEDCGEERINLYKFTTGRWLLYRNIIAGVF